MQHGGLAVIERGKAAVDRLGEFVRFGDAFAVRAERLGHVRDPPLALAARGQARLELVSLGRNAPGIDALGADFTACQPPLFTTMVKIGS
jgi:hypothetical protein